MLNTPSSINLAEIEIYNTKGQKIITSITTATNIAKGKYKSSSPEVENKIIKIKKDFKNVNERESDKDIELEL